jgi:hypothetical protein
MRQEKMMVLAAVEDTEGLSPQDALRLAEDAPPPDVTRIYAKDYVPALQSLIDKGYSITKGSEKLVEMGCPFSPDAIRKALQRESA